MLNVLVVTNIQITGCGPMIVGPDSIWYSKRHFTINTLNEAATRPIKEGTNDVIPASY